MKKKKKLSLLFGVKDATTCNAASQCQTREIITTTTTNIIIILK